MNLLRHSFARPKQQVSTKRLKPWPKNFATDSEAVNRFIQHLAFIQKQWSELKPVISMTVLRQASFDSAGWLCE